MRKVISGNLHENFITCLFTHVFRGSTLDVLAKWIIVLIIQRQYLEFIVLNKSNINSVGVRAVGSLRDAVSTYRVFVKNSNATSVPYYL